MRYKAIVLFIILLSINYSYSIISTPLDLNSTQNVTVLYNVSSQSEVYIMSYQQYTNFLYNNQLSYIVKKSAFGLGYIQTKLNKGRYYIAISPGSYNDRIVILNSTSSIYLVQLNGSRYNISINSSRYDNISVSLMSTDSLRVYSDQLLLSSIYNAFRIFRVNFPADIDTLYNISLSYNGNGYLAYTIDYKITPINLSIFPNNKPRAIGLSSISFCPNVAPKAIYTRGIYSNLNLSYINLSQGVTFQQNSILYNARLNRAYWLQNVISLSNSRFNLIDNIWNFSSKLSNLNALTISGYGSIQRYESNSYYVYSTQSYRYNLPLNISLLTEIVNDSGDAEVLLYYIYNNKSYIYDRVRLSIPYNGSYITVDPFMLLKGNHIMDAEFVLGNYNDSSVSNIYARLFLGYLDNGSIKPFSCYYTFGIDTNESISNVTVVKRGGYIYMIPGQDNISSYIALSNISINASNIKSKPQSISNSSNGLNLSIISSVSNSSSNSYNSSLNLSYIEQQYNSYISNLQNLFYLVLLLFILTLLYIIIVIRAKARYNGKR
ncbi:MAG: thermopsin [Candidatus Micrarchaeota archaeon]|nr:MAG: thermopsin [Candidatus Micrarchaeota archaeon]